MPGATSSGTDEGRDASSGSRAAASTQASVAQRRSSAWLEKPSARILSSVANSGSDRRTRIDFTRTDLHRWASWARTLLQWVTGCFTILKMSAEKKGITVRFDAHELRELDELAARYRVSSATIIRWALRALANHVERNDGRLVLPLELGDEPSMGSKGASPRGAGGGPKKRGV